MIGVLSGGKRQQEQQEREHQHDAGIRRAVVQGRADLLQRGEGRGHARQVQVATHVRHHDRPRRDPDPAPPPCVPRPNRPTTAARRRRASRPTTIKIGYYIAKPDPTYDPIPQGGRRVRLARRLGEGVPGLLRHLRTTDTSCTAARSSSCASTGPAASTDEVAAKADADKAAAAGVFAVVGGPAQARSFETELARKHILCIAACVTASPESIVARELAVPLAEPVRTRIRPR